MVELVRTNSSNADFRRLVSMLDRELAERDGDDAEYYAQFNKVDQLPCVVVAFIEGNAVGCGSFKKFDEHTAEVKRMFVQPAYRRQGVAEKILSELETWAREISYHSLVLETGIVQPEALALYSKSGYQRIPNYGQYIHMPKSVCFQKTIQG